MQKNRKRLLANRQFLYLWAEQILTQFSYNLINFALIVNVFKLTRSNFSVGILLLCFFIPSALTALIAGMVSDHFHRKKIMLVANLIWAFLILAYIPFLKNFWLICFVAILIQITDEFFSNANAAAIPNVVEKENLMLANSFFSFTNYLTLITGSLFVGFLVRIFSPYAPFMLASFLVFLGTFFVSKLEFKQRLIKIPTKEIAIEHIKKELKKGWKFINSSRSVKTLVAFSVLLQGFLGLILAISPGFLENVLSVKAEDASFVFILPLGLGLLAAGYFLEKFGKKFRKIQLIQRGMVLIGLSFLFLSLTAKSPKMAGLIKNTYHFEKILHISLPLTLIVIGLGFGGALVFVPAQTAFQEKVPSEVRGRVLSVNTLLNYMFSALLTLSSGFIADKIGFFPILLIFAIFGIFLGLFSKKILIEAKVLEK